MATRMMLTIGLVIYLVGLGFLFNAIGEDFNSAIDIEYTTEGQSVNNNFIGNIVTGVTNVPIWLNAIFITIPLIILGYLIVLSFLPTTNAGG